MGKFFPSLVSVFFIFWGIFSPLSYPESATLASTPYILIATPLTVTKFSDAILALLLSHWTDDQGNVLPLSPIHACVHTQAHIVCHNLYTYVHGCVSVNLKNRDEIFDRSQCTIGDGFGHLSSARGLKLRTHSHKSLLVQSCDFSV